MLISKAWLLKGFVLAHNAPAEIVSAADAIIAEISRGGVTMVTVGVEQIIPAPLPVPPPIVEEEQILESKPEKKRHAWSAEARQAAATRMRARIAAGKMGRKPTLDATAASDEPAPKFSEPELRITVPAPRRKSSLTDADWPEIKRMLTQGRDRKLIASDCEEEPEDLDFFIASCQRREQREGNFAAPHESGA